MSQLTRFVLVHGIEIPIDVHVVDGRQWLVCPFRGLHCGRVLVDLGEMALDTMSWHIEHGHVPQLVRVRLMAS